jgi:putative endonuclease
LNLLTLFRGRRGEAQARAFLEKKGYAFVCANYRTKMGELDLVMRKGDCVVFVEVKKRSRSDYGLPQEFVTAAKQLKVVKTALLYIKLKRLVGLNFRFDVVAIGEDDRIEHIENAFTAPPGKYTL